MRTLAGIVVMFLLQLPVAGLGHGPEEGTAAYAKASLSERVGETVPREAPVVDEHGGEMLLGTLLDRPAILTLVYYRCRDVCPEMLIGLAKALAKTRFRPGEDYRVITMSIDDTDTPETAMARKRDLFTSRESSLPEDSWRFLTGSPETIRRISEAVGVTYRRTGKGFIHPEVLVFLSAGGTIVRYVHLSRFSYGASHPVSFSPVEIGDGLTAASQTRIGAPGSRSPLYCSVDREGMKGYFGILQAAGIVTLLMILALVLFLRRGRRRGGKMRD